MNLNELMRLL